MKIFQRVLHAGVVLAVVAMAFLVAIAVLVAWALVMLPETRIYVEWAMALVFVLLLGAFVFGVWTRCSYRLLLPMGVLLALGLTWLAHDEPDGFIPRVPGPFGSPDSKGFQILVWMAKASSSSRISDRNQGNLLTTDLKLPAKQADWSTYTNAHRGEILAAWEKDKVGREWINSLITSAPSGLVPDKIKDTLLSYSIVREVFEIRMLKAQLLFAENNVDEAAGITEQTIQAIEKLSRGGGTLVNEMIAAVLLRRSCETLSYFVDAHGFSAATKHRLVAALRGFRGGGELLKRTFDAERLYAYQTVVEMKDRSSSPFAELTGFHPLFSRIILSSFVTRFLYNPKLAEQQYDRFLEQIGQLAEARKFNESSPLFRSAKDERLPSFEIKDPLGRMMAVMSVPAFEKVAEHFWQIDDLRLALIKRLEEETVLDTAK